MIFGISKTTIEGFLSFLIQTLTFISGYQGFQAILNPHASRIWLYITVSATFITGLLQVWVRLLQGDAPVVPPADATGAGPSRRAALGILACMAFLPAAFLSGCAVSVKAFLSTAISAVVAILKVAPAQPWSPTLSAALQRLQASVLGWTAGTVPQIVIEGANAVAALLNAIPLTSAYSPLIDAAVAGFDVVLGLFAAPSSTTMVGAVYKRLPSSAFTGHRGDVGYTLTLTAIDRAAATRLHRPEEAFRQHFNDLAIENGFSAAKI